MVVVTIPPSKIEMIWDYAERTYKNHTATFRGVDEEVENEDNLSMEKVFCGKVGEVASAMLLHTEAMFKTDIDDGFDLVKDGVKYAVKSKKVTEFPINIDNYFVHVPIYQYDKIKRSSDKIIGCLVRAPEVDVVGDLPIREYDQLKVLHLAGEKIAPNFTLPEPDSYGVSFSKLHPYLHRYAIGRNNTQKGLEEWF
jgi:hypothetical protein